ncbi:hypothetical protein AMATHDRAFT_148803 [Amanita thiersii Skay4041]|uniref:Major facilitator superfamily (MFS) profile domain-containing protein n=1 Tax=Amanita thiersii Skay4041 TaxID=703135 RepID=A0A2A9NMG5_9AGAR|nr:hypothetical protein AMATHDRAFT_148803 [Amanita thiersii Skay4041]
MSIEDDRLTIHDPEQVNEKYSKEFSSEDQPLPPTVSDSGLRAWLVVLGSFLAQFCTFGYTNAFGVYNDYYVREYLSEYTSSQISWIGSVQLLLTLSTGLFTGRAFDAGYFYHMTIVGGFTLVFSLFMLSLTHPQQYYQVFLCQGLLTSIGIGLVHVPSLAILSQYFKRNRALTMGISTSGAAFGGTIHPIMLNKLFHGRIGFHNGIRASAGFILGLMVLSVALMKPALPPTKQEGSLFRDFRKFLREPPYLLTTIGTCFIICGFYFPVFFLQLSAIQQGISPRLAFYSLTILNGASVVGRIVPNLVVHRSGVFNAVIFCTIACSALVFCDLAVKNAVGIVMFALVYGFFNGTYAGLVAPMAASLAKNDSEIGARMGVCFTFTGTCSISYLPIAGAFLSASFDWWKPFLFSGLSGLTGTIFFVVVRYLLVKQRGTQFV